MRTEFVFITKRSLLYVKVFTCGEHKECYRWKQRKPQPSVEGYPSASKQLPCTLWVHYSLPFSSKVPVKVGFTKFHQKLEVLIQAPQLGYSSAKLHLGFTNSSICAERTSGENKKQWNFTLEIWRRRENKRNPHSRVNVPISLEHGMSTINQPKEFGTLSCDAGYYQNTVTS